MQQAQVLNYFPLTGYCYTKPGVILRLEQAEDLCSLEKEILTRRSSGELLSTSRNFQGKLEWSVRDVYYEIISALSYGAPIYVGV